MEVKVVKNKRNINLIKEIMLQSLVETADVVKGDLIKSQTMPFDSGALQNRSTFVDDNKKLKGKVSIVSDTPYARRLYYHPEYNFKKDGNKDAGGMWFEPYISGNKKTYAKNIFGKLVRSKMK